MNKNFEKNNQPVKVGLALGSGAARGLSHIGVLKAIEESGIEINYISGCSIGALIGGAYAVGFSAAEIEEIALQTDWKLMAKLFSPALSSASIINSSYLNEFLYTLYGNKTFNDLKISFSAIATDIITGKMVVLDRGDLLTTIRASISMPIIFSPVTYGEYKLVDGGLVNPTPVNVVKDMKMDKVIAVNFRKFNTYIVDNANEKKVLTSAGFVKNLSLNDKIHYFLKNPLQYLNNYKSTWQDDPKLRDILYNMFIIVQVQIGELNMQIAKPDILIEPDTSNFKTFDFSKAKKLINIGYLAAKEKLKRVDFS